MSSIANESQTLAAFASLSAVDLLALRKAAAIRLSGTRFSEPSDLIHEALCRCLDRRRVWPLAVPFTVFLSNAMKSIADGDRKSMSSRASFSDNNDECQKVLERLSNFQHSSLSPEDICMQIQEAALVQSRADALMTDLRDDPAALAVLSGWMKGISAKEAIATGEISQKQYDAARKRVTRKIASQNQNRRLH